MASTSPESVFCLRCATALVSRVVDHRARSVCPVCGWKLFLDPKVAVAALLEVDGGIVLCRRANEPGIGRWSFPGGFVDRGESVESALLREIVEETGLSARLGSLVGVYSRADHPVVLIAYAAAAEGALRLSAEATEIGVFDPIALPEMAFEHDRRIIQDWQSIVVRGNAGA